MVYAWYNIGAMHSDCVFCKIVRKEIPAEVVYEDGDIVAFKDINAKAPVHLVVIPKKHLSTLNDLGAEDINTAGRILKVISELALSSGIDKRGYRVVVNCNSDGGQEVMHLHFHLLGGRSLAWPPG